MKRMIRLFILLTIAILITMFSVNIVKSTRESRRIISSLNYIQAIYPHVRATDTLDGYEIIYSSGRISFYKDRALSFGYSNYGKTNQSKFIITLKEKRLVNKFLEHMMDALEDGAYEKALENKDEKIII